MTLFNHLQKYCIAYAIVGLGIYLHYHKFNSRPPCVDQDRDKCELYKHYGYCTLQSLPDLYQSMIFQCPVTCNLCELATNPYKRCSREFLNISSTPALFPGLSYEIILMYHLPGIIILML